MVSSNPKAIMVGTTVSSKAEADKIATECVSSRISACVDIDKIESVYAWQHKVQHETEYRLLLKTVEA